MNPNQSDKPTTQHPTKEATPPAATPNAPGVRVEEDDGQQLPQRQQQQQQQDGPTDEHEEEFDQDQDARPSGELSSEGDQAEPARGRRRDSDKDGAIERQESPLDDADRPESR